MPQPSRRSGPRPAPRCGRRRAAWPSGREDWSSVPPPLPRAGPWTGAWNWACADRRRWGRDAIRPVHDPGDPIGSVWVLQGFVVHPVVGHGPKQVLPWQASSVRSKPLRSGHVHRMSLPLRVHQVKAAQTTCGVTQLQRCLELLHRSIAAKVRQEHQPAIAVAKTGVCPDFRKLLEPPPAEWPAGLKELNELNEIPAINRRVKKDLHQTHRGHRTGVGAAHNDVVEHTNVHQ